MSVNVATLLTRPPTDPFSPPLTDTDIIPIILDLLTGDKKGGKQSFDKKELKYVTHRMYELFS